MPSPYDPPSRYGFPDLPDRVPVILPAEVPWDAPIHTLSGFWLETRCSCGHGFKPFRWLAANLGWNLTLRQIVDSGVCEKCRERYSSLHLVARADYQDKLHGGAQRALVLRG
jgi:hypothetical protein